mmetsp:Transcript_29963/g.38625  ORF Transcript_29963/g.38625 Transcript_29963/m.38625 type:complete len:86 (-) Transcript_29963:1-258(-)
MLLLSSLSTRIPKGDSELIDAPLFIGDEIQIGEHDMMVRSDWRRTAAAAALKSKKRSSSKPKKKRVLSFLLLCSWLIEASVPKMV